MKILNNDSNGSVTVFLITEIWEDEEMPSRATWNDWRGTYIVISKLRQKRSGWRVFSARLYKQEDEDGQQVEIV